MGRKIRADDAIRAATIIDDDLLAQALGELGPEIAAEDVVAAPGWEGNDPAYRFIGEIRLFRRLRCGRTERKQGACNKRISDVYLHHEGSSIVPRPPGPLARVAPVCPYYGRAYARLRARFLIAGAPGGSSDGPRP